MAEENFREFIARNYTEFDTGKYCRNKSIADLTDKEIPIAPTLTTPPEEIQPNEHNENYFGGYFASFKDQIGSLKSFLKTS